MWDAIHKQTGERKDANKIWIEYKKPHEEKWICCKIHNFKVTPVKEHLRKINDKKIFVLPHFRIVGHEHFCPGESDKHWNLKVSIAEKIQTKKIILPFNYKFKKELLENRLERTKKNRRADILFEFTNYNSLYGKGLVIEIAITETKDSLILKTIDWVKLGYSVSWIFNEPEKKLDVNYPYGLYRDIIKWCKQLNWNTKKAIENGAFPIKKEKNTDGSSEHELYGLDVWCNG